MDSRDRDMRDRDRPTNSKTVIHADDLEEARRDPRVRRFWDEAIAYGQRLRREGRDHSV